MKKIIIGFCLLLSLSVPGLADSMEDQALATALSFAELVTDGNFRAAYWSGSPLLQLANPEQEWLDDIDRRQKVLGRVIDRELKTTRTITNLASFPDDNYLVALFSTRTELKAKAHETLLLHQVDGSWRVCSYKIH